MVDFGINIINIFRKKNGILINHIIHFILGIISLKYTFIIPLYILYQIYDSIDFNNLMNYPKDSIIFDISVFCIGYWINYFYQQKHISFNM